MNLLNLMWSSTGRHSLHSHRQYEPFEKILNSILSFRNLKKLRIENCFTSLAIIEKLYCCHDENTTVSYNSAPSNLQSLHTLGCEGDLCFFGRYLACISMKNFRILESSEKAVTEALLTTDLPVQLKELYLTVSTMSTISCYGTTWRG